MPICPLPSPLTPAVPRAAPLAAALGGLLVVLLVVLLGAPPARACTPGLAVVVATSPVDGAADAPADAAPMAVVLGGLGDLSQARLTADGVEVEAEFDVTEGAFTPVAQPKLVVARPAAPLPDGSEVELTLVLDGAAEPVLRFTVAGGAAAPPGDPGLRVRRLAQEAQEDGMFNTCMPERWAEATLGLEAATAGGLVSLWWVDGGERELLDVVDPSAGEVEVIRSLTEDEAAGLDEACFEAVHLGVDGVPGGSSGEVCGRLSDEKQGCAAAPGAGGGALLGLLGLGLAAGRRRRSAGSWAGPAAGPAAGSGAGLAAALLACEAAGGGKGGGAGGADGTDGTDGADGSDGAGTDSGDPAEWDAGYLQLADGTTCVVDDDVLFGFCGASSTAFWGDASTELAVAPCPISMSATVWMHPETGPAGEVHSLVAHEERGPGEASVWFDVDGASTVSASGTAQAVRESPDRIAISFAVPELLDFVSREPVALGVEGRVLCRP